MASRHRREPADSANAPKTALDAKAEEIARILAGVRDQLCHGDLLLHPLVVRGVQAFLEQVNLFYAHADWQHGRHRTEAESEDQATRKPPKSELEPNPLAATTAAEFVAVLRQYREWHGSPSWRNMAATARQLVSHSTMQKAVASDALPKFDVVKAIVLGCDGSEEDLREFAAAWQRIERRTTHHVLTNGTRWDAR